MTRRGKYWLLAGSLILAVLIIASIYTIHRSITGGNNAKPAFYEQGSSEGEFIIRDYNGIVCVFHEEYSNVPAIVTDIAMDSLSDSDKTLLLNGIKVSSREEVLMYLEDFGS